MSFVSLLLVVVSGLSWSLVYLDCIRTGFRQKTFCMPLFPLALNLSWEGLYSYADLFVRHSVSAQALANACWFCLDVCILITWFRFGKEEVSSSLERKLFVPWTILVVVVSFVLQILFLHEFGSVEGEKYSAFLQNIVMSVAFLDLLKQRKSTRGQTMAIAVLKCVGTITPTILGTMEGNLFILVTGIICFVFDVLYIVFLHLVRSRSIQTGK